jgi:ABC-type transport system involved in cytochrome c biogenesis ATPase subunit
MKASTGGLLERSGELARLRELTELAREGRGSAVVIEGPAGIGKTSLLDAAAEQGADAGDAGVERPRRAARARSELEPGPAAVRDRDRGGR